MLIVIIIYDQLLFRPLATFGSRFRVELSAGEEPQRSWVLHLVPPHALAARPLGHSGPALRHDGPVAPRIAAALSAFRRRRELGEGSAFGSDLDHRRGRRHALGALAHLSTLSARSSTLADFGQTVELTFFTMLRVIALMLLASLVWVPIGVQIGLRPAACRKNSAARAISRRLSRQCRVSDRRRLDLALLAQSRHLAELPHRLRNAMVYSLQCDRRRHALSPTISRKPPASFRVGGLDWWTKVMLPGVFPAYVTGALTASGGSWNAAIVAEYVKWGNDTVSAHGIGAYIAQATEAGDYPAHRARRRGDVGLRHLLQPSVVATAGAARRTPVPAGLRLRSCSTLQRSRFSKSKTFASAIAPAPAKKAPWCSIMSRSL